METYITQYRWVIRFALAAVLFSLGVLSGYRWNDSGWKLKESTRIAQEERSKAEATTKALEVSAQHQEAVRALEQHYVQERSKYEAQINDLQRSIRAGRVRVSLPGVCSTGAPEAPGGIDAAGSCELQSGTAEALIDLSKRADEVAMKFSALQEYVRTLGD